MAPLWQNFIRPASLAEALQALSADPGSACPIAGGTDLLLDLRQEHKPPVRTMVDLTCLPELAKLEARPHDLFIGAAVPLTQIVASPLVAQHAQALAEACDLIGGPQVRNVATLGGNVAHALPAADGAIGLLALDACAWVAFLDSTNASPTIEKRTLLDLYAGPGKSRLKPEELIVGFSISLSAPGQASAFERVMTARGVALPVINLAVWLKRIGDQIADVRIAIGPAGPLPQRACAAEAILRSSPPDPETLTEAEAALLTEVHFRTSPHRASAGYRTYLAGKLLTKAVIRAWERTI